MGSPLVIGVMPTRNRSDMARLAAKRFQEQTYPNKLLMVINSGAGPLFRESETLREPCIVGADALSIGELRNVGATHAIAAGADVIVHVDDDDWSHPNRIAEQVEILERNPGVLVTGYNSALFWDALGENCRHVPGDCSGFHGGDAWLYTHPSAKYCLGTSLCYRREAWEARQFPDAHHGEDRLWVQGFPPSRVHSESSLAHGPDFAPRMIGLIHGANTGAYQREHRMNATSCWQRASGADEFCREVFA